MLLKSLDINVYYLDNNGAFDLLGEVNEYTSLIWPDKFNGYATFELNAPVTPENKELLKKGNIIWCGGENACIIEIITSETNDKGQKTYKVKGRTLEMLLTTRIIWGTYNCSNKLSSTVMYEIVNNHCVNPSNLNRKIPFLECATDDKVGKKISFQKTGDEVYNTLESIASDADIGFTIIFKPKEKKLVFKVFEGIDRSNLNDERNLVIFSTDLEDILSSTYYTNSQDEKNVAFIMGEGEGSARKHQITGDDTTSGFERKELYVDARDLQSEIYNDDGTTTTLSDEDYNKALISRGENKLAEHITIETFEALMRVIGDVQYKYGVDYKKGDTVVIQDTDLGIQVIAKVTESTENYDDEYELIITFGYSMPSLIQKVKRQIST